MSSSWAGCCGWLCLSRRLDQVSSGGASTLEQAVILLLSPCVSVTPRRSHSGARWPLVMPVATAVDLAGSVARYRLRKPQAASFVRK